jgi:hypothetical protein
MSLFLILKTGLAKIDTNLSIPIAMYLFTVNYNFKQFNDISKFKFI